MRINRHDTNGTKPLLGKGELGYDDYIAGGDVGRVYVGTGSENIALAEKSEIDYHAGRTDNPHSVTKDQVGLGNVDNTSDTDKPVSTATSNALATKVNKVASTDNAIVRFDGTSGEVQNSGVIIDDAGNLGLGISNPNSKIDIRFPAFTGKNQTHRILMQSLSDNYTNTLGSKIGITFNGRTTDFTTNGGTSTASIYAVNEDNSSYSRNQGLVFYTSAMDSIETEKMRIDSAGNVGIGTTSSAWGAGHKAIDFGGAGNISSDSSIMALRANSYYNGLSEIYKTNGYASLFYQDLGTFQWYTAPSGTAGNAIPWNQAMTLDASGNLLIGTTTDNGFDKLQVNGSIKSIRNGRNIGQLLNISYNDNLSHNLGAGFANNNFLIEITSDSGIHTIPVYSYGGNGIGYRWNALNPDTGSWINSGASDLVLTFTERGANPNTYTLTLSSSNGALTIQATTKNSSYNLTITTI